MSLLRCEVTPGYGVIARRAGGLLWASQHVTPQVWNTLLSALHLDPGPDDGSNQVLLGILHSLGPQANDPTLAFALLLSSGERAQAMLHGPVDVTVDGERVPGPVYDGTMFTRQFRLQGQVYVGSVGSGATEGPSRLALDLGEGVVPGAGARLFAGGGDAPPQFGPASGAQPGVGPTNYGQPEGAPGRHGAPEAAGYPSRDSADPYQSVAPSPAGGGQAYSAAPQAIATDAPPQVPGPQSSPAFPAAPAVSPSLAPPPGPSAPPQGQVQGGFRVDLHSGQPAPAAPLPTGPGDPFAEGAAQAPGVRVEGRYCDRGHFNHPHARFCQTCGQGLAATSPPSAGVRPPLGVLVFEDGSTFVLDQDYVIGRRPDRHELVLSGQARPLTVHDPDNVLSSAHAALQLRDWDVFVVDLGSLNGSHVAPPGAVDWTRVPPGTPTRLVPGCRMLFGWTVVTFAPSYQ